KMVEVTVKFSNRLAPSDPHKNAVLIIGQRHHLVTMPYEEISMKFGTRVTKELYDSAMDQIKGSLLDLVPLYMKYANLAKINAQDTTLLLIVILYLNSLSVIQQEKMNMLWLCVNTNIFWHRRVLLHAATQGTARKVLEHPIQ
ncbi:hypothetical protein AVEN_40628-1, partial [Araneus ventricosus]